MKLVIIAVATALSFPFCCHGGNKVNEGEVRDSRVRTFVYPKRIVWQTPSSKTARVEKMQRLLEPKHGQVCEGSFGSSTGTKLVNSGEAAGVLIDFGCEIHGGVQLGMSPRGASGARVRLRFGESVAEAMSSLGGKKNATNDHALRDFEQRLPRFGSIEVGNTGFRFLRIDLVTKGEVGFEFVRAVSLMRPMKAIGSFRSSDERLNKVFDTAVRTVHLCCQEYLWDGIKRDRLVWMGDTHPETMAILDVFGAASVLSESLDYMAAVTSPRGWMNTMPTYTLWWIRNLAEWYRFTGDAEYVRRHGDYLEKTFDRVLSGMKNGEWRAGNFLDWPTKHNDKAAWAGTQGLALDAARETALLADAIGRKSLADKARGMAAQLAKLKPSPHGEKSAAAMLALSGLRNPKEMFAEVLGKNGHSGVSTFYGYYMIEAMSAAGENQRALDTVRDYWGAMLDVGATSFWEDFKLSWTNNCFRIDELPVEGRKDIHGDYGEFCYKGFRHSLCHGWSAGPASWCIRHVLGIRPLDVGCKTVEVRPFLGDLDWAEGAMALPDGRAVRVRVEKNGDGTLKTTVDAPSGVTVKSTSQSSSASACAASEWPVARSFDGEHLLRVALPMGGIGTGAVSLSGRGELVDWEIMNRPNKAMSETERLVDSRTFFAIRVKGASHESTTMLAGPVHPTELYSSEGKCAPQSGLPRFREASFEGAFPFGKVYLSDNDLPVRVVIKGFSPFVPGDSSASSLPVASLEYEVENLSSEPLEVSIAAFVRNIVGNDGNPVRFTSRRLTISGGENRNRTALREGAGLRGVMCLSDGVAKNSPAWGTFALSTPDADGSLTCRESFATKSWSATVLDFWDDLSNDGSLNPELRGSEPHGGVCMKKSVAPRAKTSWRFAFTWNFPNRPAWSDVKTIVGNWYSKNYTDAWDAAEKIVPKLGELEAKSLAFTRKVLAIDAPAEIKEAALSNLGVLKSQTVFRVPSGHLLGWEGSFEHEGSCQGSCTHVWNYENAVACLFPDLARSMRDVEFNYALDPKDGAMHFRVRLPLGSKPGKSVAADGQMGCIMKAYRDWRICGDDKWLAAIWPKVKRALEFAWIPADKWTWNAKWRKGGWDVGKSGLMDGEQHNTMDVNYYGPNSQMGFWYLGALRAAEEMAKAVKDDAFAKECRAIYEKGTKRIDAELFNGDYYEQKITEGHGELKYQLGKCCLVDQLVGQQMAHLWDLGDLAKKENLRKTCESIMKWNFLEDFSRHFNNMRTYCVGGESGLLMGSWPRGRLKTPFPYFGEVMTGFEYVAAAEMIFQGMDADAVKVVKAIRDRHDGLKRNPYSEPECGHNYARSMASWNCLLAWVKMHGGDVSDLIAR